MRTLAKKYQKAGVQIRFTRDLVKISVHAAVVLHVLHHIGTLSLVRGDYSDLIRLHPALHQSRHYLLHVRCFSPVQVGGSRG